MEPYNFDKVYKFYQLSKEEVLRHFEVDPELGLSREEVEKRVLQYGKNKLREESRDSWSRVFARQFNNPLIYILLLAAGIIFFVGPDRMDAFIITGVLLFNAILGTVQEGKAQNILDSLKQYIKATCVVLRDGQTIFIDESELVPGDIILLLEGERVPADARVIESVNLMVDQAVLTGESRPVKKIIEQLKNTVLDSVDVHDQINMVFKGTYIVAGSGKAIITNIGQNTQIGKISECVHDVQEDMPLRKELNNLSKWIVGFILFVCMAIFIIGFFTGQPIRELFVTLTALFICVVPEGLPIVLTLILVMGARKLAKRQVLVKKMQAVEGLGKVDIILIDKTGTLTRNELVVSKLVVDDKEYEISGLGYFTEGHVFFDKKLIETQDNKKLMLIAKAGCLLNRAEINYISATNTFEIKGDPTEASMFVMAKKLGLQKDCLHKSCEVIYEIPFSSKWRYHAVFCKINGVTTVFVSGAPEVLMERSQNITQENKVKLDLLLKDGFRVVAVAVKEFSEQDLKNLEAIVLGLDLKEKEKFFEEFVSSGLEYLGVCGINDSIRSEVVDLVKKTKMAGINIVMLTGDHRETAIFVASRVGIYNNGDLAIDGSTLDKMSEQQLLEDLDNITVFARVTPEQKLRIVSAYKSKDKIVAMTGDGINDAPSLVAANIGIAMGQIGTEVAKEASDIILLDDSFASVVTAIEFGRHIFYTLRRVILYFFSTNMGEILVVLFSVALRLPLPITAAQILWLNLITDGFLDTALSAEQTDKDIIKPNGFKKGSKIININLMYKVFYMALPMGIASIAIFYYYYPYDIVHARTMTLVTMAMFQWFNALNCRSEKKSVFELGFFSNKWLLLAITVVFGLQFFVIYNPFMQKIFSTKPISAAQWGLVLLVSSSIFFIEEIRKFIARRI